MMSRRCELLLLTCILFVLHVSISVSAQCPSECGSSCQYGSLICSGDSNSKGKLRRLPSTENLPKTIKKIILQNQAPVFEDVDINSGMFDEYANAGFEIQDISMTNCGLKSIKYQAFKKMKKLKQIVLSNNKIETVEDYAFDTELPLNMLILNDNPSLKLNKNSFRGLSASTLSLKNCGLTTLSYDTIEPLENNLKHLILDGNNLRSLEFRFDRMFRSIKQLSVKNNPFNCNCDLKWLSSALVYRSSNFPDSSLSNKDSSLNKKELPKCSLPNSLTDKELEKIPAEMFTCHPPYLSELSLEMISSDKAQLKCIPKSSGVASIIYSRLTADGDRSQNQIYANAIEASKMSFFNITRSADEERFRCVILGRDANSSAYVRIRWPRTSHKKIIDTLDINNDQTEKPKTIESPDKKLKEIPREPPAEKNFFFQKKYTLLEMIGAVIGTFTVTLALFLFIYRCFVYKKSKERKKSPYSNYNYEHNVVMFTPDTQTYDIPHHPNYPPPPPPPRDHFLDFRNQRTLPHNRV